MSAKWYYLLSTLGLVVVGTLFYRSRPSAQRPALLDDDVPAGVREVEARHAREDAAGVPRSYSAGLPQ